MNHTWLGRYRDVLSDSHNQDQIVTTAINCQIPWKGKKRSMIATKSCGSEILAILRHAQSSISSLTPYSLFLHFTILLWIWQQLKERIRGAETGLWFNVLRFTIASQYLVVTIWLWDLVAPDSDYRVVRIWQHVSVATLVVRMFALEVFRNNGNKN